MEKGHLRCDANVSVRLKGAEKFGTKAEVKNLNSFRFLKQALDYEIARQVAVLEGGGRVVQETRLYDPDRGETFGMRSKEDAHDYRYFPEPDLVPLRIGEQWLAEVRAAMPELPARKRARFIAGVRAARIRCRRAHRRRAPPANISKPRRKISGDPKTAANWVMGDLMGLLKAEGKEIDESPGERGESGRTGGADRRQANSPANWPRRFSPRCLPRAMRRRAIMEREGLKQISDTGALEQIIDDVIAANPKQVEQYRGGKTTVINFLVGQAMKATRGQANVAVVTELLKQKLG